MKLHVLNSAESGAAMDRALPRPSRARRWRLGCGVLLALAGIALLWWQRAPRLQVATSAQLASVLAGEFRDELALRARVEPLRSVQLDANEGGRVEAVMARDGDWVAQGAPLYRLHSPEQEQLLMQRSAEVAQQLANVSLQRSAQAASLAQNRRELAQLQTAAQQALDHYQRQAQLAAEGFVSVSSLEKARADRALAQRLLQQAEQDQRIEADTRQQSLNDMDRAVAGLQRGLRWLEQARERLLQRAPMAGQLSGFNLQLGASLRPGDRLGRIDDAGGGVQLVADVDEYYLPKLQTGLIAHSASGELRLAQTLPQVQGGKVRVLLRWKDGAKANLRAGQSLEVRLQLSEATPALLLQDGPGVQSPVYVVQGRELQRRSVRLGRRAAGQVEVLAGLAAGEQVLISQPPSQAERLLLP